MSKDLAQISISQAILCVDLLTSQMSHLAGIGKSLFSFYFMWRLAKMGGQTIVWERKGAEKGRYLISPNGVFGGSMEDFSDVLANMDTW